MFRENLLMNLMPGISIPKEKICSQIEGLEKNKDKIYNGGKEEERSSDASLVILNEARTFTSVIDLSRKRTRKKIQKYHRFCDRIGNDVGDCFLN